MTKVYLVEETDIGDRYSYITGVFATLESAIASVGTPGKDLRGGPADIRPGGGRAVWMADHRPVEIMEWTVSAPPGGSAPDDDRVHAGIGPGHVQRSDCPCSPTLTHFESKYVEPCDIWLHGDLIDKHAREGQ